MPLYGTECKFCGARSTVFRRVSERDRLEPCADCGGTVTRVIEAPAVRPEIQPYVSPATGKLIESRAARRDDLRRSNSLEWEPGLRQDILRRKAELDEKVIQKVEATVDNTVRDLVNAGKLET